MTSPAGSTAKLFALRTPTPSRCPSLRPPASPAKGRHGESGRLPSNVEGNFLVPAGTLFSLVVHSRGGVVSGRRKNHARGALGCGNSLAGAKFALTNQRMRARACLSDVN